ncbi:MAG: hypothetical protein ACON4T_03505 [Synechococcus sp.]
MGKLYVCGYWPIRGNLKRSGQHYSTLLPQTLQLIRGEELVFYSSSDDVLCQVDSMCQQLSIRMRPVLLAVDDLPASGLAERLVRCCAAMRLDQWQKPRSFHGEKGAIHYWRDYKASGQDVLRAMYSIWLSKFALVAEQASCSEHARLVWIDSTLARFNRRRSNWRFWLVQDHPQKFSHYGSDMCRYGQKLPLNASYVSGPREQWSAFQALFLQKAELATQMPYGNDEETILSECMREQPDWFQRIGLPYKRLTARQRMKARLNDWLLALHPQAH